MAIKLIGVPGDKILPEARDAQTQDFVMINHPVFFVDKSADYLKLTHIPKDSNPVNKVKQLVAIGLKSALIASTIEKLKIASPLESRYWSMSPYRLGDPPHKQAIKFSARPHLPVSSQVPDHPKQSYLRDAMSEHLAVANAIFDFEIQPRTSPNMSVENSRDEWPESDAPFTKVATITIPQQKCDTPGRDRLSEDLVFSPWHALPQHRPLGALNRMRRIVYQASSKMRHELGATPAGEPDKMVDTNVS